MKTALITGVTGQDGAYLAQLLLKKKYRVFGTFRRSSTPNFWRLNFLKILDKINLIPCDILDYSSVNESVKISRPNEIYNLAAQSFVKVSFEQPNITTELDGLSTVRFLETIRTIDPKIKFYQASTSEIYGNQSKKKLNEKTEMLPSSPYGAAKLYSYHMVKIYRNAYNLFACNGILFNHESPIRGLEFVTRKITNAAAQIKLGLIKKLELGNLNIYRDWGDAEEYVEGMWRILQHKTPDDFIIATGKSHSIIDLLDFSFLRLGLNWKEYVVQKKELLRAADVQYLLGDCTKIKNKINWHPKIQFKKTIEKMVDEDYKRWKDKINGVSFPWDAENYPTNIKIIYRKIKKNNIKK
jgi:GDPmannose 4,6-dehydratase